jgi:hypothetical protein
MWQPQRTLAVLTALTLYVPHALFGQGCEALLQHGLRNVTRVASSDVYSRVDFAQDCGSDWSSRSDQTIASLAIRIGLNGGKAGFSRTETEQALKEWCRINESKVHTDRAAMTETSILADYAVNAWSQCVALEREDVRIRPAVTPDAQTVTVAVQYTGTGRVGPQFLGALADGYRLESVMGPTKVRQKALDNVPFTIPKNALVVLRYQRVVPRDTTIGEAKYSYYPRGSIDVSASTKSVQLYFPAEWAPPLPEQQATAMARQLSGMAQQIMDLQARNASVTAALELQESRLMGAMRDSVTAARYRGFTNGTYPAILARSCPEGWRTLGTVGLITTNESYSQMAAAFAPGGRFNSGWMFFHPQLCAL